MGSYRTSNCLLKEIKEMQIINEIVGIKQGCTLVSNQLGHLVDRRYSGPIIHLLQVIKDLFLKIY